MSGNERKNERNRKVWRDRGERERGRKRERERKTKKLFICLKGTVPFGTPFRIAALSCIGCCCWRLFIVLGVTLKFIFIVETLEHKFENLQRYSTISQRTWGQDCPGRIDELLGPPLALFMSEVSFV